MSRQVHFQQRTPFIATIVRWTERAIARFAKHLRLIIVVVLGLLICVETAEFTFGISDSFHIGEIIIYTFLLGTVGLLVQVILDAHAKQERSMKILQYKHKISLELLSYQTLDELTSLLVKQLAELMDARAVYLFFNHPANDGFESVAAWTNSEFESIPALKVHCLTCKADTASNQLQPHYSALSSDSSFSNAQESYCYPIFYKGEVYTLLRILLKPGKRITDEQLELMAGLSDEIIIALMAGQDRKRLSELEHAETALSERHAMSHYLHNNLGQNLGYLRMKLEQLVDEVSPSGNGHGLSVELKRMKDIADESYQFVRNKLEVSIPDSTPLLVNYLQEHAKKVADRSNLDIRFINNGATKAVPLELQQAVFFVFQEALSNVEKHSHASTVNVCLDWEPDQLSVTISDNGRGFNSHEVVRSKHFGLEIIRERMAEIGGSAEITASENTGTTIKLSAPLPAVKKVKEVK